MEVQLVTQESIYILQLLLLHSEALQLLLQRVPRPESSGSDTGLSPVGQSRREVPEPPQPTPSDKEEQRLYSELLPTGLIIIFKFTPGQTVQ